MDAPVGLELGFVAMQVHTKPAGVLTPTQDPEAQSTATPQTKPKTDPNVHTIGGMIITSHIWQSRWRFFWVTMVVFLVEATLGAWPVVALSLWNWTALFALPHFLWWIKALLLLPAVLRNMARPYKLASAKIQHPGNPEPVGIWRYFLNSAYTWDLTMWAILSILGHTIISGIILLFTLVTHSVFDTNLEWILMLVFHVVAIIESIISPMIVMYYAIDQPTRQIQERVLSESTTLPEDTSTPSPPPINSKLRWPTSAINDLTTANQEVIH